MRTFSETFRKHLIACLLGPLSVIPATILYTLAFKFIAPEANADNFDLFPLVVIVALMVAYPATLFVGLPISFILQKFNRFNLLNLLIAVTTCLLIYGYLTNARMIELVLVTYYAFFVSSSCWYLYKRG